MLPISSRERSLIIFHKKNGESNANISKWLCVSISTITRVWARYQTTGSYETKPQNSGRKPLVSDETMQMVTEKVNEVPDITLLELIEELSLPISESALCRRLKKLGLTYKKRRSTQQHKNVRM